MTDDLFMLDLFRVEAENHARTLGEGLAELERAGSAAADAAGIEPLMRAAHSLKGAARIVGLDAAVGLAHAMEDVLVRVGKGDLELNAGHFENLLLGADLFQELAESAPEAIPATADAMGERLASAARALEEDAGAQPAGEPPAPLKKDEPEAVPVPRPEPAPEPVPEPKLEPAPEPAPAQEAAAEPEPVPELSLENLADPSMLELFCMEAQTHAQALENGLVQLEESGVSASAIEPLMRAAHSIKGAARIVGLDPAVGLAHSMEDMLVQAGKGELDLTSGHVDQLLAGVDIYLRLAEAGPDGLADKMGEIYPELYVLEQAVVRGPQAQPEPAPEPQSEPKPEPQPEPPPKPAPAQEATATPEPEPVPELSLENLADPSMLELFCMEAQTHAQALENGLVQLEESGVSASAIEPLMRAAHSIKGAARIVGLDPAVGLAHSMEDMLVQAGKGELDLTSGHVDQLLAGVDIYLRLAEAGPDGLADKMGEIYPELYALEQAVVRGPQAQPEPQAPAQPVQQPAQQPKSAPEKTAPDSAPEAPQPVASEPARKKETQPPSPARSDAKKAPEPKGPAGDARRSDSVVRVSAANLDRIMALAGEYMVDARRIKEFTSDLREVKNGLRDTFLSLLTLREYAESMHMADRHEVPVGPESPGGAAVFFERKPEVDCEAILTRTLDKISSTSSTLVRHMEMFETYSRRTDNLSDRLYNAVVDSRMRPFNDGILGFPRLIRDVSRTLGKKIRLEIKGKETRVDRDILEKLEAPLNHILRNAADHGIETAEERGASGKPETATITLEARHSAGMLVIRISDDGRGMDTEKIRAKVVKRGMAGKDMAARMTDAELLDFLFLPGFSTAEQVTEISGRGVGLDVVHTMVQEVGGTVRADTALGKGTVFTLQLPITLSVIRTLLVDVAGEPYAVPLTRIDRIATVSQDELKTVQDRQYYVFDSGNVGLVAASQVLELPSVEPDGETVNVVVVSDRHKRYGLVVDDFLGEQDLVVRPLDPRLGKVRDIYAAARLADGSPVLIIDVEDIVRSVDNILEGGRLSSVGGGRAEDTAEAARILVVDDSLTVREVQRKLLENHGYQVETAVDGMDGLNAAQAGDYDLIISDVDMPRMNGIELVRRIKNDNRLKEIPVMIVSYKDREEDRLKGLEAGAAYYLTKSSFQDETLLTAVADLIGPSGK